MRDAVNAVEWEQLVERGTVICGETDYVTERLSELEEATGIDHLLDWTRLGCMAEEFMKGHMARMSDHIMPSLR